MATSQPLHNVMLVVVSMLPLSMCLHLFACRPLRRASYHLVHCFLTKPCHPLSQKTFGISPCALLLSFPLSQQTHKQICTKQAHLQQSLEPIGSLCKIFNWVLHISPCFSETWGFNAMFAEFYRQL